LQQKLRAEKREQHCAEKAERLHERQQRRVDKLERQQARQGVDGDELFLPPCVRKARRLVSDHWASPQNGWRPGLSNVALAPNERPASSSAALRDGEASERCDLALDSDDEPCDYDLLEPEESQAKREIWHEINKDLLAFWDAKRRQKEQNKRRCSEEAKAKATKSNQKHMRLEHLVVEREGVKDRARKRLARSRSRSPSPAAIVFLKEDKTSKWERGIDSLFDDSSTPVCDSLPTGSFSLVDEPELAENSPCDDLRTLFDL